MTPPLRNRLRGTEHMDAKVDIEIADQRKRRRAHPTARGGTFEDAERRIGALFSDALARSASVEMNIMHSWLRAGSSARDVA